MFDNGAVGLSVMPLRLRRRRLLARPADETPPYMAEVFDQSHLKPFRRLLIASIVAILGRSEPGINSAPVLVVFACQHPRP